MAINKMERQEAWIIEEVLGNLLIDHTEFTEARRYLVSKDYTSSIVIDLLLDHIHEVESEITETLKELFDCEKASNSG